MQAPIKGRIFLVGCPRSGTTLLQSLLAAHPQIASFPETRLFLSLEMSRGFWRRGLGLASRRAKPRFNQFLHEIDHDEMQKLLPRTALFIPQYAQAFIRVLDTLTKQQDKSFWLEKSPPHLRCIDLIEQWVTGPKFIHITRNGADVVASLYEVTHRHPEAWHGVWDIDRCIRKWIEDVRLSSDHLHKPNHTLVQYEQLVEDPRAILIELCEFIGTEFNEAMLQDYGAVAKQVSLKWELWKESVGEAIQAGNSKKFYELFNQEQRQYILKQLSEVNLDELSMKSIKRPDNTNI